MKDKIQNGLEALTSRWWFYLLLLLLVFIPPYASKGYDATARMDLILQTLQEPFIYAIPALFPIAKAIPFILIVGLLLFGNKMRRLFNAYVALLYLALALWQTGGQTEKYGLVIISGNLALVLVVALVWIWETIAARNDFAPRKRPLWRWWVAPLAALAFLAPIDSHTLAPDFSPLLLLTNEAGLTYCMMTPVILAVLTLFHPTVNRALFRVSSFVGIFFGVMNMITWFGLEQWGWWMGVLHIPLLVIAIYGFLLGRRKAEGAAKQI